MNLIFSQVWVKQQRRAGILGMIGNRFKINAVLNSKQYVALATRRLNNHVKYYEVRLIWSRICGLYDLNWDRLLLIIIIKFDNQHYHMKDPETSWYAGDNEKFTKQTVAKEAHFTATATGNLMTFEMISHWRRHWPKFINDTNTGAIKTDPGEMG